MDALAENIKYLESQVQLNKGFNETVDPINDQKSDLGSNLLGDDGEYDNTRGKDNRQVLNVQKQMLRNQDHQLDEIQGIAVDMRMNGQMIGQELDLQNHMVDQLNHQMGRTDVKLMRVDGKLKKLIAESNQ